MRKVALLHELKAHQRTIDYWFKSAWEGIPPPFYSSVDLRYSGTKLVPVDVNLYPAGFNNLSIDNERSVAHSMRQLVLNAQPSGKRLLIITENHTRNPYYLEHLTKLRALLTEAGFIVKLSMLNQQAQVLEAPSREVLTFESLSKHAHYLSIGTFVPDCIILNHDLSEGFPTLLDAIQQPILPSPKLGWWQRRKSFYFEKYRQVCEDFCQHFSWDPWQFSAFFKQESNVDFNHIDASSGLFTTAEQLLNTIGQKYQDYSLLDNPYLVIKADAGTYGMGVLVIEQLEQLKSLSRKHRQRMLKTKGNQSIGNVIVQEGVPSLTAVEASVAEPVIYCVGSEPIGGFYRSHTARNTHESLNTPGMVFTPFEPSNNSERFAYDVVARLAVLAAGKEMQAMCITE